MNKYDELDRDNNIFHPNKNIKINTIDNYFLVHHDIHYYDFSIENND